MIKMRMLCAGALVAMLAGSAWAGVVAEFNYAGDTWGDPPTAKAATTLDTTLLDSAELALGPDLQGRGNVANMVLPTTNSDNMADDYWTLTVTPADEGVKLTSVAFNVRTNGDPDQWIFNIYSSQTGGAPTASNQAAGSLAMVAIDTEDELTDLATVAASLDAADFGNLTDPVTFYLQIAAVQGTGKYSQYDFFGFQEGVVASVEGEAVPEPATLALLGLGSLVAMRRRRRA